MKLNKKTNKYLKLLKISVIFFMIAGFVVGGLNQGVANKLDSEKAELIRWIYLMYENVFRAGIVIFTSYLTIKYLKTKNKKISKMRYVSLISFSIFMLIFYAFVPMITGIWEFSAVLMPFPWSTLPFQLLHDGYFFSNSFSSKLIDILLVAYILYQVVIFIGTLIVGRRFHCSMICPYGGCHAESFGEALPLIKSKSSSDEGINPIIHKLFMILKVIMIVFMLGILFIWAVNTIFEVEILSYALLRKIEMVKYMFFELIFMQLGYIIVNGRGYCYYCPAGTLLGFVAKITNQRIETGLTECIDCGLCNKVCNMSINIREKALEGKAVVDVNCVGCGHCVDICPKNNLKYTTNFIDKHFSDSNVYEKQDQSRISEERRM